MPFDIVVGEYEDDGLILIQHSLRKIKKNEKALNKALDRLEANGWNNILEAYHYSKANIAFSITPAFSKEASTGRTAFNLINFNLTDGMTHINSSIRRPQLVSFFKTILKKPSEAEWLVNTGLDKGFYLAEMIDFIEYLYEEYKQEISQLYPDTEYTKAMFIKTLVLEQMEETRRTDYAYAGSKMLLGYKKDWMSYVLKDLSMDNLINGLTTELKDSPSHSNVKLLTIHMNIWKGSYPHSPEELAEAANLPSEWFKNLFGIINKSFRLKK